MSPNDQDGMMERRRRATPQELAMGTQQMIAAHMRMQREATEVPIEDGSLEGDEKEEKEVEDSQMNGPEFGHYQDRVSQEMIMRTTEEETRSAEASRQRRMSDTSGKGHGAHRDELRTPQRTVRGSASVRKEGTGDGHGDERTGLSPPQMSLFSDAQLRHFQDLQEKAAWLYRPVPPVEKPQWMAEEEHRLRKQQEQESARRDQEVLQIWEKMRSFGERECGAASQRGSQSEGGVIGVCHP